MKEFINYRCYSDYRMETTTIQLSREMKEKIASFGSKGESFEVILRRIYSLATKEHLREFLMSDEGYVSIDEARKEVEKLWPRSQ